MSDELVREKLRLYADDVTPVQLPAFAGVTARRRRRRTQRLLSGASALVVVALVVVLASVLGGGSSSSPASGLASELIGGKWSLSSITTAGSEWKAPAGNDFSLSFTASGYTGKDSCNTTSGTVSYGKDTLHLSSGPMTGIGCLDGDQARMQDAFRLLIDKDLPAAVSGGTLTITAGQTVFALTRVQRAAPVDLSKALPGTTWALISIGSAGADVSSSTAVPATVNANIAFHAGDFVANDGCNEHKGQASFTVDTVVFSGGVNSALNLCLQPTGDIGGAYDKVLNGSTKPKLVGDTLTIANATQSLVFTRESPAWVERRLTAFTWNLQSAKGSAAPKGWTLTFTATSYRAASKCLAHNGSVSYDSSVSMFEGTTEGTCEPTAADTQVGKLFAELGAGPVAVGFFRGGMTLTAHGITLSFGPGEATSTPVPASPVPSGPSGGIVGMKATLIASTWKLETLKTPTDNWHAIEGSAATLTFSNKGYQVSDGCEGEGHALSYDETAGTVTVDRSGESMGSACSMGAFPPKGSVPPKAYFDAFNGSLHVALSGDSLTLTRTGVVLTFSKQVAANASAPAVTPVKTLLAGSPWRLVSVDAPGTFWRAIPGSTASLRFGTSAFTAADGCNTLRNGLSYDQAGGLTFGGGVAETVACSVPPPGPPQGTPAPPLFFSSLSGAAKVTLDGDVLRLTLGTTVLTLTRAGADYVDPQAGDTLQSLLTGHTWTLHRIVQADEIWGDPQQVVLRFGPHGYIINPDCNDHLGAISYSGGRLVMRFLSASAMGCPHAETVQAHSAVVADALFSGPVSVEEDAGLLTLWNSSTSLELHQGPAPQHDLALNFPPASAAPPSAAGRS